MEITLESVISLISLFIGGSGLGALFTWRYAKRVEKAKVVAVEAEAEKAKVDVERERVAVALEKQNYYQQMAKDLADDRDKWKQSSDEWRDIAKKMETEVSQMKKDQLAHDIDNDRKFSKLECRVESMSHFVCGDLGCKMRQRVSINEISPDYGKNQVD